MKTYNTFKTGTPMSPFSLTIRDNFNIFTLRIFVISKITILCFISLFIIGAFGLIPSNRQPIVLILIIFLTLTYVAFFRNLSSIYLFLKLLFGIGNVITAHGCASKTRLSSDKTFQTYDFQKLESTSFPIGSVEKGIYWTKDLVGYIKHITDAINDKDIDKLLSNLAKLSTASNTNVDELPNLIFSYYTIAKLPVEQAEAIKKLVDELVPYVNKIITK